MLTDFQYSFTIIVIKEDCWALDEVCALQSALLVWRSLKNWLIASTYEKEPVLVFELQVNKWSEPAAVNPTSADARAHSKKFELRRSLLWRTRK